jgi:putative radical SAM enzyme (TIGR03279 family)
MPPGMRETLYFKDDDSRLSFLQGNYITLTNMKEHDFERIIQYKLAPINISVHTTNPELRCMMLHNRFAGTALEKLDRLYEAGIQMNGQIVLCKGVNDGAELERTISDLSKYLPYMESVSVVPVGLSKYRDGLYPLEPFTKEDALDVINTIEKWQNICMEEHGLHFIHASDEWYLLAGLPLPEETRYDGYIQLENGVGMLRLLETEFQDALEEKSGDSVKRKVSIATGKLAAPFISKLMEDLKKKYTETEVMVYDITNEFFGERITVAGLITGQDLKKQLKNQDLGEKLLLPCHMLRSGEEVFLDDVTVSELSEYLQIPIEIVDSDGAILLNHVTI